MTAVLSQNASILIMQMYNTEYGWQVGLFYSCLQNAVCHIITLSQNHWQPSEQTVVCHVITL